MNPISVQELKNYEFDDLRKNRQKYIQEINAELIEKESQLSIKRYKRCGLLQKKKRINPYISFDLFYDNKTLLWGKQYIKMIKNAYDRLGWEVECRFTQSYGEYHTTPYLWFNFIFNVKEEYDDQK